ncbi:MAG: RecX family transcriptional regulator [Cyclobacteriaceae bacterium]|nr:RecX family transcriptional regulator [Cyclobacteriaceae bacterium]
MGSGHSSEEIAQAKQKIASYCAYQERCQQEVRDKLYSYGLFSNEVEELIAWLITENFLNEERFAITFAGGKFRVKRWGKLKISQALQLKDISAYCIRKGLSEIDNNEYQKAISDLAIKKMNELQPKYSNSYQLKDKTSRFLINRGFEPDLVWEVLKSMD